VEARVAKSSNPQTIAGRQPTLCDSLDTKAVPIIVQEESDSQDLRVGTQIGVRIMQVEERFESSGAGDPLSPVWGAQ